MENRLTFIKKDPNNRKQSFYLCSCGKTKSIRTYKIEKNLVKSCGCYSKELASARLLGKAGKNSLPVGVSGCNMLFADYKRSAERKGLVFEIDRVSFDRLTSSDCYYCGSPPSKMIYQRGAIHLAYKYNGIDRLDSEIGYILTNCVPACSIYNFAKRQMTPEQYINHCKLVVSHNTKIDGE